MVLFEIRVYVELPGRYIIDEIQLIVRTPEVVELHLLQINLILMKLT